MQQTEARTRGLGAHVFVDGQHQQARCGLGCGSAGGLHIAAHLLHELLALRLLAPEAGQCGHISLHIAQQILARGTQIQRGRDATQRFVLAGRAAGHHDQIGADAAQRLVVGLEQRARHLIAGIGVARQIGGKMDLGHSRHRQLERLHGVQRSQVVHHHTPGSERQLGHAPGMLDLDTDGLGRRRLVRLRLRPGGSGRRQQCQGGGATADQLLHEEP